MSDRLKIDFNGILGADEVRGKHVETVLRRVTKVEILVEGTPPSGASLVFKLRVATVENSQQFALAAGETYISTAASGDGLEVAASSALDVICKTPANAVDVVVWLTIETLTAAGTAATDLGLGILQTLKQFVLAEGTVAETTYDSALEWIGKGVAAAIDRYCNRTFKRATGAADVFGADRDHAILRRYPIEQVTAVALKSNETDGFVALSGQPILLDSDAGIVRFGSVQGSNEDLLRVTYDGGYWYDTTSDGSGTLPTGATQLPDDIKLAWLLQCQHIWAKRDNLGIQHGQAPDTRTTFTNLEFIPQVKELLNPYRRLAAL
jgi:hypothetical protein